MKKICIVSPHFDFCSETERLRSLKKKKLRKNEKNMEKTLDK
jgi:hypothetical protein